MSGVSTNPVIEMERKLDESIKKIPSIDDFWDVVEHIKKNFSDGIISGKVSVQFFYQIYIRFIHNIFEIL